MAKRSAIIIGAGLTGLTTAFFLKRAGWEVTILERSNRAGGSIQTHSENEFIFESGPNSGVVTHPQVADLFKLLESSIKYEPINEEARKRLIWKGYRWYALPYCLKEGIKTPLFKWRDKLKMLMEPLNNKNLGVEETLENLVNQRMGQSFLNYAIDPFILGIYAGNPASLIIKYVLPKRFNFEKEYIEFIKGNPPKKKERKNGGSKKTKQQIYSIAGGLEQLIIALIKEIGEENIKYNCDNTTIYPKEKKYLVSSEQNENKFEHLVSTVVTTTCASEIEKLLPFLNLNEKNIISTLPYARVIQVAVGYKKWRGLPLKAFGGLIPHKENRNILGILFPSAFLNNRAPKEGALLSVFLGGIKNPEMMELNDDSIKTIVMEELKLMLLIPPNEEPDLFRIFRHKQAIPQYDITTNMRLKTIAKIESQFPGLILAGNLRDGIGMAERIRQGTLIANQLTKANKQTARN